MRASEAAEPPLFWGADFSPPRTPSYPPCFPPFCPSSEDDAGSVRHSIHSPLVSTYKSSMLEDTTRLPHSLFNDERLMTAIISHPCEAPSGPAEKTFATSSRLSPAPTTFSVLRSRGCGVVAHLVSVAAWAQARAIFLSPGRNETKSSGGTSSRDSTATSRAETVDSFPQLRTPGAQHFVSKSPSWEPPRRRERDYSRRDTESMRSIPQARMGGNRHV